jgi:hypothetical protein
MLVPRTGDMAAPSPVDANVRAGPLRRPAVDLTLGIVSNTCSSDGRPVGVYRAGRAAGHLLRGYAMAPLPPPCSGAIAPFYAAVIGCVGVLSGTLVVGAADRDANAGGRW